MVWLRPWATYSFNSKLSPLYGMVWDSTQYIATEGQLQMITESFQPFNQPKNIFSIHISKNNMKSITQWAWSQYNVSIAPTEKSVKYWGASLLVTSFKST